MNTNTNNAKIDSPSNELNVLTERALSLCASSLFGFTVGECAKRAELFDVLRDVFRRLSRNTENSAPQRIISRWKVIVEETCKNAEAAHAFLHNQIKRHEVSTDGALAVFEDAITGMRRLGPTQTCRDGRKRRRGPAVLVTEQELDRFVIPSTIIAEVDHVAASVERMAGLLGELDADGLVHTWSENFQEALVFNKRWHASCIVAIAKCVAEKSDSENAKSEAIFDRLQQFGTRTIREAIKIATSQTFVARAMCYANADRKLTRELDEEWDDGPFDLRLSKCNTRLRRHQNEVKVQACGMFLLRAIISCGGAQRRPKPSEIKEYYKRSNAPEYSGRGAARTELIKRLRPLGLTIRSGRELCEI